MSDAAKGFRKCRRLVPRLLLPALMLLPALISSPGGAAEIRAEEAARHVGETATVCGLVASAKFDDRLRSQPTFLDFGKPYPDQVFTGVIFGADRAKFGAPERTLAGKRVCLTGKIVKSRGLPEIILNEPKQLTE